MFIELTDYLRCPADHDEAFLVLLPDRMDGRSVLTGQLGCPVCGRVFRLDEGVLDVGGAPPAPGEPAASALSADAIVALAGVHGPGGYVVLVGAAARAASDLLQANPGTALVALNPSATVCEAPLVSVIRGGMVPLKANSVRAVVLGPGFGGDPVWIAEAARVTLPGLRIVGEGNDPPAHVIDVIASADGVWVGTKRR